MKYYLITDKSKQIEDFEKQNNNIADIWINDTHGNVVNKKCDAHIFLSKNAMLGFGTELIRNAHKNLHPGYHWHFYPAQPNEDLHENFGLLIAPDSVEPIIGYVDFGTIGKNQKITKFIQNRLEINHLKYKVIIPDEKIDGLEDFQKDDNNIALVVIYNLNGNNISQKIRYFQLTLSSNAMLGLGTELIRLAHNFEEGKTITIKPSTKTEAIQTMGIFLTPDSCPLTIECKSFGTIDQCIEDYVQKNK